MRKNEKLFSFISLLVVVAMLFQSFMPSIFSSKAYADTDEEANFSEKFIDIADHWANKDISNLSDQGIIEGYSDGSFKPDNPITRAEFITIINRATAIEAMDYDEEFSDVAKSDWFAEQISAAAKYEYIKGYDDGTIRPRKYISRNEAAVILARILKLELNSEMTFVDKDEIPDWARSYVGAVSNAGYIKGYADNTFAGRRNITRAESSSLINNSLSILGKYLVKETDDSEKKTSSKKKVEKPVLASISPNSGAFGTVMTIRGSNFSEDVSENDVTFTGDKQGIIKAEVMESSESELRVIVPGLVAETVKVGVSVNGYETTTKDYIIESLMDPTPTEFGNETRETFEIMDSLVTNTLHELNIALIPFMDNQNLGDEADDIEKALNDMNQYLDDALSDLLAGKTDEELAQFDAVLSSELMKEQLAKIGVAADLLSHSTTIEALEHIDEVTEDLKEIKDEIEDLKTTLLTVKYSLAAAGIASLFLDFGLSLAAASNVIEIIDIVVDYIIEPILAILNMILALLNFAPTDAMEGTLETYAYTDELGINQYFGSMEWPENGDDPGTVYVNQSYYLRGHVDFTNDGETAENYLADLAVGQLLRKIVNFIGGIPEINIQLHDVDVKLKLDSDDTSIIKGEWVDDIGLKVTGVALGETTVRVQADLDQVIEDREALDINNPEIPSFEQGIEISKVQIERRIKTLSGVETVPEFTQGPRVDSIENDTLNIGPNEELKAYIGDILSFTGEGFSLKLGHQKVIFGPAPGYNETGVASYQPDKEYDSLKIRVPDALTGPVRVEIGVSRTDTDWWTSNTKDITILDPDLTYSYPSAIIGEIWPIEGIGFSRTTVHNTGNWNGTTTLPNEVVLETNELGITEAKNYKELQFTVPEGATSGPFKVTTIGELNTEEADTLVREFSPETSMSEDSSLGLRPSVDIDSESGNQIVAWIDQNDAMGNQIVATVLANGSTAFQDVSIVSTNIGGLQSAPPEPRVMAKDGNYYITWVGRENDNNEILFAHSDDGISWSTPINISNTNNSSLQAAIEVNDLDDDGDNDVIIVWTEEASSEDQNASVLLSTIECIDNTYYIENTRKISGEGDAADPAIDIVDDTVAVSFSEDSGTMPESYKRDVYLLIARTNGIDFTLGDKINLSNNIGGMTDDGMELWDKNGIYRSARYPSIAIGHGTDDTEKSVFIAYENTGFYKREDIYFTRYDLAEGLKETVNMSESKKHSQSPSLILDADNTPTLTWIEQGFEVENNWETPLVYGREESFDSKIVFTRSFDDGETFNEPYMTLAENTGGNRMGHLSLAGAGSALLTMVWQDDEGNNPHINMMTTLGEFAKPVNYPDNESLLKSTEYLLRSYSDRVYYNDIEPDPQNWRKGDLFLSTLDGSDLSRITRDGSVIGKASFSPDGRFVAYSHDWLYVAEADGSNPIGIWRGAIDIPLDAYWSQTGEYIAFNAVGEMYSPINGMGIVNSSGITDGVIFGPSDCGMQPWSNEDSLLYNPLNEGEGGVKGLGILYTENFDEFMFVENEYDTYPAWSPDGSRIAFVRTTENRDYTNPEYDNFGDLYIMDVNSREIIQLTDDEDAMTPTWSPDGNKIVFVSDRDDNQDVYIIDIDGELDSEINITNSLDEEDILPVFSSDGKKVLVNAGKKVNEQSEMRIKMIDLDSLQISYLTPEESSAGRAEIFNLRIEGVTVSAEHTGVNEGGDSDFTIVLDAKPLDTVIISLETVSNEMTIETSTVEFTRSNWNVPRNVRVSIEDNVLLDNDRVALISFDPQSSDDRYNNIIIPSKLIYIQDDEVLDTIPPTWPVDKMLTTSNVSSYSLTLTWTDAEDNWLVTKYNIYSKVDDGVEKLIGEVDGSINTFDVTALDTVSSYRFRVEASDAQNNVSIDGPTIELSLKDLDIPTWPEGASTSIDNETYNALSLYWTAADDNVGVSNYLIYQDGAYITKIEGGANSYRVLGLSPDTDYSFKVKASDAANNVSIDGPIVIGHTGVDSEYPVWTDADLTASNIGDDSLVLNWTEATDNVGIANYNIYQDGFKIDTVSGDIRTYKVNGLASYTKYSFKVEAVDSRGNGTNNGPMITINTFGIGFYQGAGYELGYYDVNDVQPTVFNWTRNSRFVGSDNPGMKWKYNIDNTNTTSNKSRSPEIGSDGSIYIGLEDHLTVINPDGSLKAKSYYGGRVPSVLANDSKIYYGQGGVLFEGFVDGDIINYNWGFNTDLYNTDPSVIKSNPAIGADGAIKFMIGSYLYSIDSEDMTAWVNNETSKWVFNIGGNAESYSSPAIGADGTLYVGSSSGKLFSVDSDGSEKWSYETGDSIESSPAIGSDGTIYLGSNDNKVYAFNPDGSKQWSYETGADVKSSPAIGSDGNIYIGSNDKNLYAIKSDGTKKWNFVTEGEVISSPIIDANGVLYVGDNSGNLYAINTDGSEKWVFRAKAAISSSPAIGSDGTIYFATDDSNLYALGSENGVYGFMEDAIDVNEADGSVQVTVNRRGDTSKEERIYYKSNIYDSGNLATNGGDYGGDFYNADGYLTFAEGESKKAYTINIYNDTEIEDDEIIVLELRDAVIGTTGSAIITITDDEFESKAIFDFKEKTYSVNEYDGSVDITVTRSGNIDGPVRVDYDILTTGYATAIEGADFAEVSGELTFASGETEKMITVSITDDTDIEGDETIEIILSTVIAEKGELDSEIASGDNTIITIIDNETLAAVTLTTDTTSPGAIYVTGVTPNTELRLYANNGWVSRQVYKDSITETSYIFEDVTEGTGYYATVSRDGIESARSNTVDIVYPKVGEFLGGATASLTAGTEASTIKLTINNPGVYTYYYLMGMDPFPGEPPIEGTVFAELGGQMYLPMAYTEDNIYPMMGVGDYISIVQVDGPDFIDEVVGFTTIQIQEEDMGL